MTTSNKKKRYLAPALTVVSFETEQGFAGSQTIVPDALNGIDDEQMVGYEGDNYKTCNDWGTFN